MVRVLTKKEMWARATTRQGRLVELLDRFFLDKDDIEIGHCLLSAKRVLRDLDSLRPSDGDEAATKPVEEEKCKED